MGALSKEVGRLLDRHWPYNLTTVCLLGDVASYFPDSVFSSNFTALRVRHASSSGVSRLGSAATLALDLRSHAFTLPHCDAIVCIDESHLARNADWFLTGLETAKARLVVFAAPTTGEHEVRRLVNGPEDGTNAPSDMSYTTWIQLFRSQGYNLHIRHTRELRRSVLSSGPPFVVKNLFVYKHVDTLDPSPLSAPSSGAEECVQPSPEWPLPMRNLFRKDCDLYLALFGDKSGGMRQALCSACDTLGQLFLAQQWEDLHRTMLLQAQYWEVRHCVLFRVVVNCKMGTSVLKMTHDYPCL